MQDQKYRLWIFSLILPLTLIASSCDKIISMIKEEFDSERIPAIPKQPAPMQDESQKEDAD